MTTDNEPHIVTPQEAQQAELPAADVALIRWADLVHTVAAEPDRTRAAVVKALRNYGDAKASRIATEIENGADYA